MLEQIYDAFAGRLYPYMVTLTRHRADAEDALQNLFLKLARRGRALLKVEDMEAYLFTAARNEALRCRRRRPTVPLAELGVLVARQNPGSPAEAAATLDALPPEQAEVVFLRVFEELTFKQIAETLEIPQDTAASRYRYAMEKLREKVS